MPSFISGDGQIVGYTDARSVPPDLFRPPVSRRRGWGRVTRISVPVKDRSAETAGGHSSHQWATAPPEPPVSSTLIDLRTGSRTTVPPQPADPRPVVVCPCLASDGSLLVQVANYGEDEFRCRMAKWWAYADFGAVSTWRYVPTARAQR